MPISPLNKNVIGLTAGDPAGIGPELILRSLSKNRFSGFKFIIIGDKIVFDEAKKKLACKVKNLCRYNLLDEKFFNSIKQAGQLRKRVSLLDLNIIKGKYAKGKISKLGGEASARYVIAADQLMKKGLIAALVTAPINKDAVNLAGYKWKGHTETLAKFSKTDNFAMSFVAGPLRVVLVTTHIALNEISRKLKKADILNKIILTDEYLKKYFNIKKPLIGVCGLNPHASDNGLFGSEEKNIIYPAVRTAKKKNIKARGPLSAEQLFYEAYHKKLDAVIAMYHDQALIPLKMVLRDKAVNLTMGLPYIRTSPSSGTAFDIASKYIADETTMSEAIKLAINLTKAEKNKLYGRS
jgi:4-hydroxythreonine-4-phosphate dehydrogenase